VIVELTPFETLETDQISPLLACVLRFDVKTAVAVPPLLAAIVSPPSKE
jgi:hypothetical protein